VLTINVITREFRLRCKAGDFAENSQLLVLIYYYRQHHTAPWAYSPKLQLPYEEF
jgi:hypothetical protein